MAILALGAKVTGQGIGQGDLVKVLTNMVNLINELRADHATARTELIAIGTALASVVTKYDAHTHKLPATPAEDENTSAPDTTTATGSKAPGSASAISDTSGSSVPATLSNNSDIVLTAG